MENISYLFAVFGIVWLALFGYVFGLQRRQKRLEERMASLGRERAEE